MRITFFKESLLSYLAGLLSYYRVRLELLAGNKVSQQIDHFIIPGPSKPGGCKKVDPSSDFGRSVNPMTIKRGGVMLSTVLFAPHPPWISNFLTALIIRLKVGFWF